jgi:cell fate regulator YaaT (PSP1 superfamily)
LRYEYDTYQELQKDLPPIGADIITSEGRGRVLAQEILAGRILVEMEDMRHLALDGSAVLTVLKKGGSRNSGNAKKPQRQADENASGEDFPSPDADDSPGGE